MKQTRSEKSGARSTNRRHWQAHLTAQARSGLNRAEYCRRHSLSYDAMTYWQRKLATSEKGGETTTLVPVSLPLDTLQGGHPQIQLLLPGKITVALGDGFSSTALTRLLSTLEAC